MLLFRCTYAVILFLVFATACSGPGNEMLYSVERIIEENPDSALRLLSAVDMTTLTLPDKARYHLLKVQSLVKLDSIVTDTVAISSARDYFLKHGDRQALLKADYYSAWIYYYRKDTYQAMKSAVGAYDIATKLDEDLWSARAAELMSIIFIEEYNYKEAEKYAEKAGQYYKEAGRMTSYNYCQIDLAHIYSGQKKYRQAIDALDNISLSPSLQDSIIWACADRLKLHVLFECGQYEEADSLFSEMESLAKYYPVDACSFHLKALLLGIQNRFDMAALYLDKGKGVIEDASDNAAVVRAKMNIEAFKGDYKTAYGLADSLFRIYDAVSRKAYSDEASLAQRDYYNSTAEKERITAERRKIIIISILGLLLIMTISGIIYIKMRMKLKNLELQNLLADLFSMSEKFSVQESEMTSLRESLESKEAEIGSLNRYIGEKSVVASSDDLLRQKLMELFQDNWKLLGIFNRDLTDCENIDPRSVKSIFKAIKKEVDNMASDKNMSLIEDIVNESRNNIMKNARTELTELNQRDFRLLCLLYSGMDLRAVAIFMGCQRNTLGPAKSRLKKKIQRCSSQNIEVYINSI